MHACWHSNYNWCLINKNLWHVCYLCLFGNYAITLYHIRICDIFFKCYNFVHTRWGCLGSLNPKNVPNLMVIGAVSSGWAHGSKPPGARWKSEESNTEIAVKFTCLSTSISVLRIITKSCVDLFIYQLLRRFIQLQIHAELTKVERQTIVSYYTYQTTILELPWYGPSYDFWDLCA